MADLGSGRAYKAGGFLYSAGIAIVAVLVAGFFLPEVDFPEFGSPDRAFFDMDFSDNTSGDFSESELSDYTPMFLPTRWNFRRQAGSEAETDEYGGIFSSSVDSDNSSVAEYFEPKHPKSEPLDDVKSAIMQIATRGFFQGFASKDTQPEKDLSDNIVDVYVIDMATGKTVDNFRANVKGLPTDSLWESAKFTILKSAIGGGGIPTFLEKSGSSEADAALAKEAAKNPRITALPYGYYKIVFTR